MYFGKTCGSTIRVSMVLLVKSRLGGWKLGILGPWYRPLLGNSASLGTVVAR
jgi:hypothetical protein